MMRMLGCFFFEVRVHPCRVPVQKVCLRDAFGTQGWGGFHQYDALARFRLFDCRRNSCRIASENDYLFI